MEQCARNVSDYFGNVSSSLPPCRTSREACSLNATVSLFADVTPHHSPVSPRASHHFHLSSVVEAVGRNGGVVCASLDSTLLYSEACAGAHLAMPTADPADPLWAKASRMGPGVVVDSSSGLKTLTLSKGDEGEEAVLDMSVEVRNGLINGSITRLAGTRRSWVWAFDLSQCSKTLQRAWKLLHLACRRENRQPTLRCHGRSQHSSRDTDLGL